MTNPAQGAAAGPPRSTPPGPISGAPVATTNLNRSGGPVASNTPSPMIVVDQVTKVIGTKTIVENLTFDVRKGEIFGFIGPSGSGKTSTIRLLTGTYAPTSGRVTVFGADPAHPSRRIQELMGYMPQLFVLYPNLTVRENLEFVAGLYGMGPIRRRKRINELLKFVELADAQHRVTANVSGGMQRRIELAASLLHDPPLLFVDEPTAGIDPVLRGKFWQEFRRLRDEGRTIFVTTQYVGESEYCDRIGVIRSGHLVALDTPIGLRRTALGGDVIDVEADGITAAAVQSMVQQDFVKEVRPISRRELRVHVDEAGPAIPQLLDLLSNASADVTRIEEYRPSFDEVFIDLMKRDAAFRGEETEAATAN